MKEIKLKIRLTAMETSDKLIRKCMNCGKEFEPNRADQIFCSPSCRVTYNRHQRKIEQKAEERLNEAEGLVEALKKVVENKDFVIKKLEEQVTQLQEDKRELSLRFDHENLTVAIDPKAKLIYETWCEMFATSHPDLLKETIDEFTKMGYSANRYNLPILGIIYTIMLKQKPDFMLL